MATALAHEGRTLRPRASYETVVAREQRGDVAVGSHAEHRDIEVGVACASNSRRRRTLLRCCVEVRCAHAVDVRLGDRTWQRRRLGLALIAIRVAGSDKALVAPPQVHGVQSTAACDAAWATARSVAMPTVPPVSTTSTRSLWASASVSSWSRRAAVAVATVAASGYTTTRSWRLSGARGEGGENLAVDLVVVEPAQLLCEALVEGARGQRDGVRGLVGLLDGRVVTVGADDADLAARGLEHDVLQARGRVVVRRLDLAAEAIAKPGAEQQNRRAVRVAVDARTGHALVRHLLEGGRE